MFDFAKIVQWVTVVLTSVVTIGVIASQVAAEILGVLAGWDGTWINLVLLVPAIVAIIRRVTPVSVDERGVLPK